MKTIILISAAALISAGTYSLGDNGKAPAKYTPIMTQSILGWQDTLPVPVQIKTAFTTKYPNATKVTWYNYKPGTMKPEAADWYSVMDPTDYYVTFYMDDADYVAWYDNGKWIRSAKKIDNTELPDVVSRVLATEYPGFVITDVDYETDLGQSIYEVKLEKGNIKWNVHVNPSGAIVKKKQRTLSTAQANAAMVSDFESRFPNASSVVWYAYSPDERVEVMPTDWGYNMDATDYEVRFMADGTEYVAFYDNGAWTRTDVHTFDVSKLPASVNQSINREFAGYSIKDVDREDNATRILYEVELQKGNDKCKIHYSADGSVVKKKCRTDGVKTKS